MAPACWQLQNLLRSLHRREAYRRYGRPPTDFDNVLVDQELWLLTVPSIEFRSAVSCTEAQCSGSALGLTAPTGPNECSRCVGDVAESRSILRAFATGTGTTAEMLASLRADPRILR